MLGIILFFSLLIQNIQGETRHSRLSQASEQCLFKTGSHKNIESNKNPLSLFFLLSYIALINQDGCKQKLFIAFVRKHYISKGVRKIKQQWKNKNCFVPWGGTTFCLKKTDLVSKIVRDDSAPNLGSSLRYNNSLNFCAINLKFGIYVFFWVCNF